MKAISEAGNTVIVQGYIRRKDWDKGLFSAVGVYAYEDTCEECDDIEVEVKVTRLPR